MTLPTHRIIPDPQTGYALNPERGWVSVYMPHGATNLIPNPSFEVDLGDWASLILGAGGAFTRVTDAQFRGACCAEVDLGAGASGDISTTGTGASSTRYTLSAHIKRPGGAVVRLSDVDALLDGSTTRPFQVIEYVADGWYRLSVSWVSSSTAGPGLRFYGAGEVFYVDAVQWEAGDEASTYLDGDELGLIPGEVPPAFTWNGAPHASTSTRSATTRAGGLRRNLDAYGLTVVGLVGLGMPPQGNQTTPYAGADGSFYQGARRGERPFTIAGAFQARTPLELDRLRRDLRQALTFDATGGPDSPITLELQAYAGDTPIGEAVTCVCSYEGGLEASQGSLYAEKVAIQLVEHVPGLTGLASRGGAFEEPAAPTMTYVAIRDELTQEWSYPTGLNAQPQPNAVVFGPDEKLYIGGNFTAPTTRVAAYNFALGVWETVGALSAQVNALAFDRQGRLYAGGASGLITGSTVARWDGSSWTAVGSLTDTVLALAYDSANDRVYAGGSNGANATLQRSTGAAWTGITTATAGQIRDLAFDVGSGTLYIAGSFTTLGGVADVTNVGRYTFSGGLAALGAGANAAAQSVTLDPQGRAWFLGSFSSFAGVAVDNLGRWTGQQAEAVPGVPIDSATAAYVQANPVTGDVWVGGVELAAGSGVSWLQRITPTGALWPGIGLTQGAGQHVAAAFAPARTALARSAVTAVDAPPLPVAVDNPGTLPAPVVVVQRVTALINAHAVYGPTGATVDLEVTVIAAGDTLTIDSRPERRAIASAYQGDLRRELRLGSSLAGLLLPLGASTLRVQGNLNTAIWEGVYAYRPRYGALGDAAR